MIHPVILSGGSGTRLWPLSRKSYPKQFAPLIGEESLFQASARRFDGPGFAAPVVVTGSDFRFIATQQLTEIGIDPGPVLIEPEGRNTAPAILASALHLAERDPESLILAAPSDHVIPDPEAFRSAVSAGVEVAQAGDLVTFGVTPDRSETGYGYLELSGPPEEGRAIRPRRFVEKPDAAKARRMLEAGSYLWNAGIFLFSARALISAFEAHAPQLLVPVRRAVEEARADLGFVRLAEEPWGEAEAISIDYAVMERADNLSVVPFSAGWSDLGGWNAVWQAQGPDEHGVATHGPTTALDCRDTLLRSESEKLELVGIGLDNIVAVAMPDAVLVAEMDRAQEVKQAVATLKARGARQAEQLPMDHRPWGAFQSLAVGDRFQVKRIIVEPGAALSLQSHVHRSEHWIVVAGTALVTIDGEERLVTENQSVYVPVGSVHRLQNPGKVPMALIEVQTGAYLGEDDITRYEDVYARN
ncbi:MAG: mannose-1-phosphate guanylyltransferase/mannose-6-phosphate isomerase [Pseudomonadota bacterium]